MRLRTLDSISQTQFDGFAMALAREGADCLLSSGRYPAHTVSVIGVNPHAQLRFAATTTPEEVKRFCYDTPGLSMGFVSYGYGMILRGVVSDKPQDYPLGHLKKYTATVEHDPVTLVVTIQSSSEAMGLDLEKRLRSITALQSGAGRQVVCEPRDVSLGKIAYQDGVRETLERIRSGSTYQLNLSTKFSWHCPDFDGVGFLFALRQSNPASFYACFTSGVYQVLSTSPERFVRVAQGNVLSQPIKGTLRVESVTPEAVKLLSDSPKEDAELSMIVDLIRNDISANCAYGSVRVANHKSVFGVDNLLQMYADVHGVLREDRDCLDLFFDAFPGGSITGCPKQSSMQIIEELEPHSRGIYCGSMLVVRGPREMDSSILIRTAVHDMDNGVMDYYAGSGIVVDSDPAKEYQETLAKAEKFMRMGAS